jgi:hypothetical protein
MANYNFLLENRVPDCVAPDVGLPLFYSAMKDLLILAQYGAYSATLKVKS